MKSVFASGFRKLMTAAFAFAFAATLSAPKQMFAQDKGAAAPAAAAAGGAADAMPGDAAKGEATFGVKCGSCHYIYESEGKGTGPALHGVTKRAPNRAWFSKWIKNSQALIKSGDKYANEIWNKYKPVQMTAFGDLSESDIDNLLKYIETAPEPAPKAAAAGGDGTAVGGVAEEEVGSGYWTMMGIAIFLIVAVVLSALRVISTLYKSKGVRIFNWNKINGVLFIVSLVVGMIWIFSQFAQYNRHLLPEAASEHGVEIDAMLTWTFAITFIVFLITQTMLFIYANKYRQREGVKALHYADNHRLEFIWTITPAVVLAALVLYGATVWGDVTGSNPEKEKKALNIELYAYQFGWNLRYSGEDNQLGKHNYLKIQKEYPAFNGFKAGTNFLGLEENDQTAWDDRTAEELWLPKGRPVLLKIRAQDVIHSAYMPHFRVQMNAVPGMPTQFMFTPTITTEEMRAKTGDPKFDYVLLCNKICGGAHYNMKRRVKVVTPAEYDAWVKAQTKPYFAKEEAPIADSTANNPVAQKL